MLNCKYVVQIPYSEIRSLKSVNFLWNETANFYYSDHFIISIIMILNCEFLVYFEIILSKILKNNL